MNRLVNGINISLCLQPAPHHQDLFLATEAVKLVVLRGPPRRQGATAGTTATAGDVGPRRVGATPAAVVADGLATRDGGARGRPRCPARAP